MISYLGIRKKFQIFFSNKLKKFVNQIQIEKFTTLFLQAIVKFSIFLRPNFYHSGYLFILFDCVIFYLLFKKKINK